MEILGNYYFYFQFGYSIYTEESKSEVRIFTEINETNDPIKEFTPQFYGTNVIDDQGHSSKN